MGRSQTDHSRRRFIAGAGALIIGTCLPVRIVKAAEQVANGSTPIPAGTLQANAFVHIATDGTVTVLSKHTEVGQGVYTGMATLVAEELDADWSKVQVTSAPADTSIYKNLRMGLQGTGGSSSVANAYMQMREMGALARKLLVTAASLHWKVDPATITVTDGIIHHADSGRQAGFGEFVTLAATLPIPEPGSVKLKSPNKFRLIGKETGTPRTDSPAKTTGAAFYSQDIHEENMQTVMLIKPPRFGGRLLSFDAEEALTVPGVISVRKTDSGVAIYAQNTWAAMKGREKVRAQWDDTHAETRSTAEIVTQLRNTAKNTGAIAASHGDPDAAFKQADRVIEAEYTFPYLAHAPMEPLAGYLLWDGSHVHARYGCQIQTLDQNQFAKIFSIPPENVHIETLLAGGSFGRRIDLGNPVIGPDLVADMSAVAKAVGPGQGVKLVYTREDDIRNGWYRPMMLHSFRAAIKNNRITAWTNTIAGHSFTVNSAFAAMVVKGVDRTMVEGSKEPPYVFENFRCDMHIVPGGTPVTSLRSVGSTHTGHAVECFIDQLLQEMGQDPVEGRLALMPPTSREAGALRAVAAAANWKGPEVEGGRRRGVGVARAFGTSVAQIAEVSLSETGAPIVHKIWCAVDCGIAVNPNVIRAQIEGGIGYGLGIALYGNISLNQGYVEQSNFNDYRPLRISEMPEVEVIIVPSEEAPSGVGELGMPTIAPVVANALARLGWERSALSLPLIRPAESASV